ncbi:hypothetical protein [Parabacteroides johnsonii]|jgi:transcriptional regulator with XRE-family HTH domain|uniref:hypothetical protein n=1 Tax=Parabacteroides johnsonii TaxID=387661 RepID=UPI00241FF83B|nr:hypothetical protein [Parabacteroides johnsonii]
MNSISLRFKEVLDYLVSSGEVSNNKDFASKTGMSTSMITEICKGRSNVGSLTLQNIVLAFPTINALWLLTGIGSMLQKNKEQPQTKTQEQSIESTIENSIYYKMYKEEKEENKILIEEIGALKEQIKQLEGKLKKLASAVADSNIADAV